MTIKEISNMSFENLAAVHTVSNLVMSQDLLRQV